MVMLVLMRRRVRELGKATEGRQEGGERGGKLQRTIGWEIVTALGSPNLRCGCVKRRGWRSA